jgi:hypothetical protein
VEGIGPVDSDNDGVLEAARAIRPYLKDLVDDPVAAGILDRRIAEQLTGPADRAAAATRLRALLEGQEDTAWFLNRVLTDEPHYRPPYQQPTYQRDMVALAGELSQVEADRYACPVGDYVWYRPDIGTPVPECPDHHVPLTRS